MKSEMRNEVIVEFIYQKFLQLYSFFAYLCLSVHINIDTLPYTLLPYQAIQKCKIQWTGKLDLHGMFSLLWSFSNRFLDACGAVVEGSAGVVRQVLHKIYPIID